MRMMGVLLVVCFVSGYVCGGNVTIDFTGHFESSYTGGYITIANDYAAGDILTGQIVYNTQDFVRSEYSSLPVTQNIDYTLTQTGGLNLSIQRSGVKIASAASLFPSMLFEIKSESAAGGDNPIDPEIYAYSESFSLQAVEILSGYPAWESGFGIRLSNSIYGLMEMPSLKEPLTILNPDYYGSSYVYIDDVFCVSQNSGNGGEYYVFTLDTISVVPEPASAVILIVGSVLMAVKRRGKRS